MSAWRRLVRRAVVVNLDNGDAFRGILFEQRGPLLVLRNAEVVIPGGARPVDGEVVVERARVTFIQVLP